MVNEKQERYIKRQLRVLIGSTEKIDNLHDVDIEKINEAFEKKKIYNYNLITNKTKDGKIYFAFEDKDTGFYYMTTII